MIQIGGVNVAPLEVEQVLLHSIPTSCRPMSWAFLKSSPRQSSCGAGRQPIPQQLSPSVVSGWQATRYRRGLLFAQLPRTATGKIHKPSLAEELAGNSTT